MMNENLFVTALKVAGGKISLEYTDLEQSRPYTTEEKDVPHPDLYNALKKLGPFLGKVYYQSNNMDKITITGFSNKNDSDYVVIKGMLEVPSGKKVAINSDAINIEQETYGFEQELEAAVENIRGEAEKFFFEGKTAQQTIPFDKEPAPKQEKEIPAEPPPPTEPIHDGKMAAAGEDLTDPERPPLDDEPKGDSPGELGDMGTHGEPQDNMPPPPGPVGPGKPQGNGVPGL